MDKLLLEFIDTLDGSFKKLLEETGSASGVSKLTVSQLQYIDAVHTLSEPSITELADALSITKASVTVGVNKLVRQGYVVKARSREDKRVFRVSLTEAGETLVKAKLQTFENYVAVIRAALTEDEAKQFEAIVSKLVTHFRQS